MLRAIRCPPLPADARRFRSKQRRSSRRATVASADSTKIKMVRMLSAQTKIPRLRAPFPAPFARGQSRSTRDDNSLGAVAAPIRLAFGSLRAGDGAHKGLRARQRGLTLIELIVAISLLTILVGAAMPIARVRVQREREREL